MTSGIYELKFTSGKVYIGKSIDMEKRYSQHTQKLLDGTAAKSMQSEYYMCGEDLPSQYVVLRCHSDHIDIIEAYYIHQRIMTLGRDNVLNSNIPELVPGIHNLIAADPKLLQLSTPQHVDEIQALEEENENLAEELEHLKNEGFISVGTLDRLRDVEDQLSEQKFLYQSACSEIRTLQKKLNSPWWKRLFM